MRIAVLAASGPTGRELTRIALERGHQVIALARTPSKVDAIFGPHASLEVRKADVLDLEGTRQALDGAEAVVSGLGISKGDPAGTLEAGARSLAGYHDGRTVWLGALGVGASLGFGGAPYDWSLRLLLRDELAEKKLADDIMTKAGGTVVHAGPLAGKTRGAGHLLSLNAVRRRVVPPSVSRADVAWAMLDEAENPRYAGQIVGVLPGRQ